MSVKLHPEYQDRDVVTLSVTPSEEMMNAAGLKWQVDGDHRYLVRDDNSHGINDYLTIKDDKIEIRVEEHDNGKYTFLPNAGLTDGNGQKRLPSTIDKNSAPGRAFMDEVSKEWKEIRNEFDKSRSSVDVYIDEALKDGPKVEYNYEHGIMASLVDINTDDMKAIRELENSGLILPCSDVCHEIIVSVNEADQVVARGNSTLINEKIDALSPEAKNLYASTLRDHKDRLTKEAAGFQENAHKERLQGHHDRMMDTFLKEDVDAKASGKSLEEYRNENFEGKNQYLFERDKLNAQFEAVKERASLIEREPSKVEAADTKKVATELNLMPLNKMNDADEIRVKNPDYMSKMYSTNLVQKDGSKTDGLTTKLRIGYDGDGNIKLLHPAGGSLAQRHDHDAYKHNIKLITEEVQKSFERKEAKTYNASVAILDKQDISLSKTKDGLYLVDYAEGSLGGTKNTQLPGRTASNMTQANAFAQTMLDERRKAMRDIYADSKFVVVSQDQKGVLDRNPFHLNKVVTAYSNAGEKLKVARSTISNELLAKKDNGRTVPIVEENSLQHFKAASAEYQKKGISMHRMGEGNVAVNMHGSREFYRAQSVTEASMIANRLEYTREKSMNIQQTNQAQRQNTNVQESKSNVLPFKRQHMNDFQVQPPSRIASMNAGREQRVNAVVKPSNYQTSTNVDEKKHSYSR